MKKKKVTPSKLENTVFIIWKLILNYRKIYFINKPTHTHSHINSRGSIEILKHGKMLLNFKTKKKSPKQL